MSREELLERNTALESENAALKKALAKAEHERNRLAKWQFDATREKFRPQAPVSALQTNLFGVSAIPEVDVAQAEKPKQPSAKRGGRNPLPKALPEEKVDLYPNIDTERLVYMGCESTEKVHHRSASMVKVVTHRHKFMDPETGEIIIAEAPEDAFPKCIAATSLISWILVNKHMDHMPVHRMIAKIKREYRWEIPPATMHNWIHLAQLKLLILYELLKSKIKASNYLQVDESGIKVQDRRSKDRKKWDLHKGQMWVYYDPLEELVFFNYKSGRGAIHALEMLGNYKGMLQTDAYAAYETLTRDRSDLVSLVACTTHIRRKFVEALDNDKQNAERVLIYFQQLYAIEAECREEGLCHEQRQEKRISESKPIMEKLHELLQALLDHTLKDEPIGNAVRHALKRWPAMQHFLRDGRLEICNNRIENQIRPLALGRKNYLFAGSQEGAERLAMMYSFCATCKRNDVNPLEWFADVLDRIDKHKVQQLDELLPKRWKQLRAQNKPQN